MKNTITDRELALTMCFFTDIALVCTLWDHEIGFTLAFLAIRVIFNICSKIETEKKVAKKKYRKASRKAA